MYYEQIECMVLFLFSYICWGLLCALGYDQFWRRFHGLLRKMYIVQKLDEMFCRHQLGPFGLWYVLGLVFLYWFFVLMTYLLVIRGIKVSHTTVLEFIYVFRIFSVCLMKLGALRLGAYKLIFVISFWCISPFISMQCPSLSYFISVGLKSSLSEISIATPACFQGPLAW
jgi:hypothetical protein